MGGELKCPTCGRQSGVPIPPRGGAGYTALMRNLKVGESFFFPGRRPNAGFYLAATRNGWKVSVRTTRENGIYGHRVWKLKGGAPTH
jgi:hypothetical protein